jgi:uncharacterized protein
MDEHAQRATIDFLSQSVTHGAPAGTAVEVVRTHASLVFLCGDSALKLKRAIAYSYLDYSTPERREAACREELAINQRIAPQLYLAVRAVTREPHGLALDGSGPAVDWVVAMRRFPDDALFDRIAARGALTPALITQLVAEVLAFHAAAEQTRRYGGAAAVAALIAGNDANLRKHGFDADRVARLRETQCAALDRIGALLERRREMGHVRHCHGDLHLGNVCLWQGTPTLFDAIEFDPTLSRIDVLYDLAFLLMDLWRRNLRDFASAVLNRYLDGSDEADGLATLPLFLSIRAAIRAHVAAAADKQAEAAAYFDLALTLIEPQPPRLIAVGGLSGTGKSTLAAGLAPHFGSAPGARVLRSDVVRKRLFGAAPGARLRPQAYSEAASEQVFAVLQTQAAAALRAGYAVVLDAVAARPEQRQAFAAVAQAAGVPFAGLWLEAPVDTLERRIGARRDDVSDATVEVLHQQLDYELGAINWIRLPADGAPADVLAAACAALGR